MASDLMTMASNLIAVASNLLVEERSIEYPCSELAHGEGSGHCSMAN